MKLIFLLILICIVDAKMEKLNNLTISSLPTAHMPVIKLQLADSVYYDKVLAHLLDSAIG